MTDGGEQVPGGWWINVETKPGVIDSAEALRAFSIALSSDETLHSASATLDPGAGVLRASITVEEPRQVPATEIAVAAFRRALDAIGFREDAPGPDVIEGPDLLVEVVGPLPG